MLHRKIPQFSRNFLRNQAIDQIRAKFGENAVMRASFLKSSVSPTSGGLNKEKRRENIEREADEEAHWTQG